MSISDNLIDSADRGLAYGDGVFETMASIDGELHNWSLHWSRLKLGAERLALVLPKENYLCNAIQDKLRYANALTENKVVKLIITRGVGGRGYQFPKTVKLTIIITLHDWPKKSTDDYHIGIMAKVCQTCLAQQPLLAGIKHLNRLEQVIARNELYHPYQEGIMLACDENDDQLDSRLIEGTTSNLFFVKKGHLFTPKIDTCGVQGTIRTLILHHAKIMNIHYKEDHYRLHNLSDASEVFFCNSIFGLVPVASIQVSNDIYWSYNRQPSSDSLFARLAQMINVPLKRPIE